MIKKGGCVYITTSGRDHIPQKMRHVQSRPVGRFGRTSRKFTSFPLSSHADHDQLMEFVKEDRPEEGLHLHGVSRTY